MQLDAFFETKRNSRDPSFDLHACSSARGRDGCNAAVILSDARRGQAHGDAATPQQLIDIGIAIGTWDRKICRVFFIVARRFDIKASDDLCDRSPVCTNDAVQRYIAFTKIIEWLVGRGFEAVA